MTDLGRVGKAELIWRNDRCGMFGKFIILTIAILAIGALLHKWATRAGLIQPKPPAPSSARQIGNMGFRLTKFDIAMLCLVGLYFLWGATQIFH